jgi:hypothetical protein
MNRIFRPVDPPERSYSPSWKQWRGLLYVEGRRSLVTVAGLLRSRSFRLVMLLVGLLVQMVLIVLAWELVQVCADVAEMWVAMARKYLELTS